MSSLRKSIFLCSLWFAGMAYVQSPVANGFLIDKNSPLQVTPEERILKVNKGKISLPPHSLVFITISKE